MIILMIRWCSNWKEKRITRKISRFERKYGRKPRIGFFASSPKMAAFLISELERYGFTVLRLKQPEGDKYLDTGELPQNILRSQPLDGVFACRLEKRYVAFWDPDDDNRRLWYKYRDFEANSVIIDSWDYSTTDKPQEEALKEGAFRMFKTILWR